MARSTNASSAATHSSSEDIMKTLPYTAADKADPSDDIVS
jgi:hypothetical protein